MKYEYDLCQSLQLIFYTQLSLMKLFQRETLVTEEVLSHCHELGSALFN